MNCRIRHQNSSIYEPSLSHKPFRAGTLDTDQRYYQPPSFSRVPTIKYGVTVVLAKLSNNLFVAHRVISVLRSKRVAFTSKAEINFGTSRHRVYEYTA